MGNAVSPKIAGKGHHHKNSGYITHFLSSRYPQVTQEHHIVRVFNQENHAMKTKQDPYKTFVPAAPFIALGMAAAMMPWLPLAFFMMLGGKGRE